LKKKSGTSQTSQNLSQDDVVSQNERVLKQIQDFKNAEVVNSFANINNIDQKMAILSQQDLVGQQNPNSLANLVAA